MAQNNLSHLIDPVVRQNADGQKILVVYAAAWSVAAAFQIRPDFVASSICHYLTSEFPHYTILMPAFTTGFVAGRCDLDNAASTTGIISETFRKWAGTRRTRSAFFSFAVNGPRRDELVNLLPRDAWGDGSVYDWLFGNDAQIVTIGIHPTHCSFTHYAEWLSRNTITYRYARAFSGTLCHEGRELTHEETLLVRQEDPKPINDFTWLLPHYLENGMHLASTKGLSVSSMSAKRKISTIMPFLSKDPLALIKNKSAFLSHR